MKENKYLNSRDFISFDGKCPYNCRHCFTFDILSESKNRTIDQLIEDLNSKIDIVYVSHYKENFLNPKEGIELCEKVYNKLNQNIFIITRSILEDDDLSRLEILKNKMYSDNKFLALGVSICAYESYYKIEDSEKVPTPQNRLNFLKAASERGIPSILILRPVYPNSIIPVNELFQIINESSKYLSAVIASGLAVNKGILSRLNLHENDFQYLKGDNSKYLIGAVSNDTRYIDVDKEIEAIKKMCIQNNLAFFSHSLDALNYIYKKILVDKS